jgi:hypothetical protein
MEDPIRLLRFFQHIDAGGPSVAKERSIRQFEAIRTQVVIQSEEPPS